MQTVASTSTITDIATPATMIDKLSVWPGAVDAPGAVDTLGEVDTPGAVDTSGAVGIPGEVDTPGVVCTPGSSVQCCAYKLKGSVEKWDNRF